MKEIESILQRLDHLESHQAIRTLATAYAIACDEHDIPRLTDLFSKDAVFCSPNGAMVSTGRDSIRDMFSAILKTRGPGFHWTHDVHATIDPGNADRATGLVYSVVSLAAMKYKDSYIREKGVWRFSRREINFFYYVPVTKYNEGLNKTDRVYIDGAWHAADFPESLDSWRRFAAGEEL
jgi:uncharacterized protein (TIGR02246 family)